MLAWAWLTLQSAGVAANTTNSLGPGTSYLIPALDWLALRAETSSFFAALLALCTPQSVNFSLQTFLTIFSMWMAMSIAMMLPSAAPMLRTYADIAHVAQDRGETTVSLSVLALGYLAVWAGFSLIVTVLHLVFMAGSGWDPVKPLTGWLGGIILLGAGLYQFAPIKDACLEKCRNPFNTLFAQWSNQSAAIFKIGIQQGMFCVGCCWAIMMVMFVVGTMNLAWMAFFTLFAIVEKSGRGKVTSQVSGCILMVWGGGLLVLYIANSFNWLT